MVVLADRDLLVDPYWARAGARVDPRDGPRVDRVADWALAKLFPATRSTARVTAPNKEVTRTGKRGRGFDIEESPGIVNVW